LSSPLARRKVQLKLFDLPRKLPERAGRVFQEIRELAGRISFRGDWHEYSQELHSPERLEAQRYADGRHHVGGSAHHRPMYASRHRGCAGQRHDQCRRQSVESERSQQPIHRSWRESGLFAPRLLCGTTSRAVRSHCWRGRQALCGTRWKSFDRRGDRSGVARPS
jgi:hypothetical protein